jgi:septum formation topological specificity factor MinE
MRGAPSEAPLQQLPEHLRAQARTQARNMAALVVFHARQVREKPTHLHRLRDPLRAMVVQYNARKAQDAA